MARTRGIVFAPFVSFKHTSEIAFGIAHVLLPLGKQCFVFLHGESVRRMPGRICHQPGVGQAQ
jgi:hypothetical protein